MICVTIARTRHKHTISEHERLAQEGAELAELRLDYIGRKSIDLTKLVKQRPTPVVVTCRRKEDGGRWARTEDERLMLLRSAIAMGVEYVDLEFDVAVKIPRYGKTKRIVSLHNFEGTPDDLEDIHRELAAMDADIVKIATYANSFDDVIRMLKLMENAKVPTIGISMGETGTLTRILAGRYNAPFTYCVYSSERRVAPGQLTFDQMKNIYRVDTIDANTMLFGVVADPVAHSYSPLIHNAAFSHENLNARYIPFRVAPEDLSTFLKWCPSGGVRGLSVTIPHKETIMAYLNKAESSAQDIGAVNTVVFDQDNELLGFNTDYRAAMDSLNEAMKHKTDNPEPFKGVNTLLLGAGGVSRAICYGLRSRGASVYVASRDLQRATRLAAQFNAKAIPWGDRYKLTPGIIVNGTPVGMFPDMDGTPHDMQNADSGTLVFDTVYNPEQTLLLKMARANGCDTISGIEMFVRQAAYQYKLFTGKPAPAQQMVKVLRKAISPINYQDLPDDEDSDDDLTSKFSPESPEDGN